MDRGRQPPVPHDPSWPAAFEEERARLAAIIGADCKAVHHIGSTAIPGIYAKPVIDILVEASSVEALDRLTPDLVAAGYIAKGEYGISGRRYFTKTNTEGIRTHHLHAYGRASPEIERHLVFRDYLLAHPEIAQDYSRLKRDILADWRGLDYYIARKATFVVETERVAVEWNRRSAQDGMPRD
ncbi:MAG: GrpB family protein [Pseudomonadota bacterium]